MCPVLCAKGNLTLLGGGESVFCRNGEVSGMFKDEEKGKVVYVILLPLWEIKDIN